MQMNEEKIVEELKQLKKKIEHIRNSSKITNALLVLILFLLFWVSLYSGFRWN